MYDRPTPGDPDPVAALTAVASWAFASDIAESCSDAERAEKMAVVASDKASLIKDTFGIHVGSELGLPAELEALSDETRALVLVGLTSISPFDPYELPYDDDLWQSGLRRVAATSGVDDDMAGRIIAAWKDVDGMHAGLTRLHLVGGAAAAAVLIGVTAFTVGGGPALLGGLGTGLSGAAATAHGLALLGGTTGLFGMAGGTVVLAVAPAAAAAGAGAVGASILRTLPSATIELEVRNAQISLQAVYRRAPGKLAETAAGLAVVEAELVQRVERETARNVDGAPRLKGAQAALRTTRNAIDWVENPERWRERSTYGKAKRETVDWTSEAVRDARRTAKNLIGRFRD
jgi:hypothetical protein